MVVFRYLKCCKDTLPEIEKCKFVIENENLKVVHFSQKIPATISCGQRSHLSHVDSDIDDDDSTNRILKRLSTKDVK